jgi:hypothetical protein
MLSPSTIGLAASKKWQSSRPVKGPGGQHRNLPRFRQGGVLTPLHAHQRVLLKGGGEGGAVAAAVYRQGAPGGHGMAIGGADHQGTQAPQFLLQQPGGPIAAQGAEAVAAHQLGEFAAVVGGRAAHRPHFHQPHRDTGPGDLPSGFGAGQAGSNHQHWIGGAHEKPALPEGIRLGAGGLNAEALGPWRISRWHA